MVFVTACSSSSQTETTGSDTTEAATTAAQTTEEETGSAVEESSAASAETTGLIEGLTADTENKELYASAEEGMEDFEWYKYTFDYEGTEVTLPYRLYTPEETVEGETYPIIVVLHGSGGLGTDNTSQMGSLVTSWASDTMQSENPAYVLAIQMVPEASVLADTEHASAEMEAACLSQYRTIIDTIADCVGNIDTDRIYLAGHSLGACYALNLLVLEPNYYGGALILAGAIVHSTWGTMLDVSELANENIYMLHGANDCWILPEDAQRVYDQLTELGSTTITLEFTSIAGLKEQGVDDDLIVEGYPAAGASGHMVTNVAISDEGTEWMEWLLSQKKGVAATTEAQEIYWTDAEEEMISSGYGMDLDYEDIGLSGTSEGNGTIVLGSGRVGADNDFAFDTDGEEEVTLHPGDTVCFTFKGYQGTGYYGLEEYNEMWTMEYTVKSGSVASIEVTDEEMTGALRDGEEALTDGQVYVKVQLADDFEGEELTLHLHFTTKDGASYYQEISAVVEQE
ncbi:MAG: hypothetical protein LUE23_05060 [Lachnospiraceae bacterium]|nr:hypothetical protein [Lachnospiraceae bacterium]